MYILDGTYQNIKDFPETTKTLKLGKKWWKMMLMLDFFFIFNVVKHKWEIDSLEEQKPVEEQTITLRQLKKE